MRCQKAKPVTSYDTYTIEWLYTFGYKVNEKGIYLKYFQCIILSETCSKVQQIHSRFGFQYTTFHLK